MWGSAEAIEGSMGAHAAQATAASCCYQFGALALGTAFCQGAAGIAGAGECSAGFGLLILVGVV